MRFTVDQHQKEYKINHAFINVGEIKKKNHGNNVQIMTALSSLQYRYVLYLKNTVRSNLPRLPGQICYFDFTVGLIHLIK